MRATNLRLWNILIGFITRGNTVAQIAEKRGLNPVTIEGHLARYVASGDIDVHAFID